MSKMKKLIVISVVCLIGFNLYAHQRKAVMHKQQIENMTWLEVESAKKTNTVVIIPLGAAAKEHGPHLPMNNDYIMANYLTKRVLAKMATALALPTINYSYYPTFLEYPGSTSIDLDIASGMVVSICRSLAKQGFNKFYVLNTGFTTIKALQAAKEQLAAEKITMDYLQPPEFFDSPAIQKIKQQKLGSHADEVETSMMLYIAPNIVRMDQAKKDQHPRLGPDGLTRNLETQTGIYSPTGTWGDPTLANKKKGRIITEAYVDYILQQINNFAAGKNSDN